MLPSYHPFSSRLQLVGITCMLLACKFEEVNPLAVDEFVYISDGAYSKEEVLRMESMVLGKLDFSLSAGTSKAFLKGYEEVAPLVAPLEALHGPAADGVATLVSASTDVQRCRQHRLSSHLMSYYLLLTTDSLLMTTNPNPNPHQVPPPLELPNRARAAGDRLPPMAA